MKSEPAYVNRATAAIITGLSVSFLAHLNDPLKGGPPMVRVGRRVLYPVADLISWMDTHACSPKRGRGRPRKGMSKRSTAEPRGCEP